MKINCFTCKYGYEDERSGIRMCHHPKMFSEDCVNFSMYEGKEIKESEKPFKEPIDGVLYAATCGIKNKEQIEESEKPVPNDLEEAAEHYASVTDQEAHGIDFIREVFVAGAEYAREQIMKGAVEGEFLYTPYPTIELDDCKDYNFKDFDKVRVIVLKKED